MKLTPGQKIAFKARPENTGPIMINGKVILLTHPEAPLSAGDLQRGQTVEFDPETGVVTIKP